MSALPDDLRAALDQFAKTRSLRFVDAVLAAVREPEPVREPPGASQAPPAKFEPAKVNGALPWWAKD